MKNNLRELRGSRSVKTLADLAGLSRSAVYMFEEGKRDPALLSAYRLAAALEVPVTKIFPSPFYVETVQVPMKKVLEQPHE